MFTDILGEKFGKLFHEYYKYILVGFVVTAVDFVILIAMTEFAHIYYMISAASAYTLASVLHYYLSIFYVFNNRNVKSKRVEFFIFFMLGILGLGVFTALMYFFTEMLHCHYIVSKILATGISFTFNFLTRKFLLFR
ncbi:MAG: GtrA family protein [Candidatus Gastranaerophilales bacterium]|nr:GtrA family protein [Candidatus Gastranaerophilales bacterium]